MRCSITNCRTVRLPLRHIRSNVGARSDVPSTSSDSTAPDGASERRAKVMTNSCRTGFQQRTTTKEKSAKPINHHRSRGPIFGHRCREDSEALVGAVETVCLANGADIFPYRFEQTSWRGAAHETVCYCGPRASLFCLNSSASLPFHWFVFCVFGPIQICFVRFRFAGASLIQTPMIHACTLLDYAHGIQVLANIL